MSIRTLSTASLGPPRSRNVRFSYDDGIALEKDAEILLQLLAGQLDAGVDFKPEQTFQYGVVVSQLVEVDAQTLELQEPDFQSLPIAIVPTMSHSLMAMRFVLEGLRAYGLSDRELRTSILESVLACSQARDWSAMVRSQPAGHATGWFLACGDPSHRHDLLANVRRVSLYEVLRAKRAALPFWSFPAGTTVVFDAQGIGVEVDGIERHCAADSFLAPLVASPQSLVTAEQQ